MDGLRKLAISSPIRPNFSTSACDSFAVVHISPTLGGFECKHADLRQADLRTFFQDGLIEESRLLGNVHNLKLVCVTYGPDSVFINERVFGEILQEIGLDPWVERLILARTYGYYHSGQMTGNGVATYYLGTSLVLTIWTTRQEQSGFATKCVILVPVGDVFGGATMAFSQLARLMTNFELFKNDSHSVLYLPFVLSVDAFTWRERDLMRGLDTIRAVESKTGHGLWIPSHFEAGRDDITNLTARLGSALNGVGNTIKHLNIIESVWSHLERLSDEMSDTEKSEETHVSNNSILSAIDILRQQSSNASGQAQYLELRIRSQFSVLFALLSHEDAKINIEVASASKDLAEAARRDGSSMKTIAVLTMNSVLNTRVD
ncbi:hypothetical protein EDB81DRAFT_766714 [Dactylonectria macrodidyma]|uniref:Uncharacterized protein n=1 Tax=Dactylonectria macrodidyma TaxID=307937 RepID=A0A9P9IHT8_9HYPO|nr:hypothetical protein EDB81DRAFT_766714 [Dactylonectria macrodidyma]